MHFYSLNHPFMTPFNLVVGSTEKKCLGVKFGNFEEQNKYRVNISISGLVCAITNVTHWGLGL